MAAELSERDRADRGSNGPDSDLDPPRANPRFMAMYATTEARLAAEPTP
jgi:hypothetical protein